MPKRFKRLIRSIIALLLVAGLAYGLGWSNILAIKQINITGTKQVVLISTSIASSNSGLKVGEPLARANMAAARKALENIDWVARSSVSRNWLNGKVSIKVEQRIPVALFSGESGALRYLDSSGVEFTALDAPSNLPQVNLMASAPETRKFAAEFVANLPEDILQAMTSLLISSNLHATMTSSLRKPDLLIEWGSGDSISTKIEVLHRLLLLPENKKISFIDLSTPTAPIVK